MATYIEEMLKINQLFIRLFPNRMIYQQIDDGTVEYHQPFNCYLIDYLHSKGMEPTYESLMDYARNSNRWDKQGYHHSEYTGNDVSVSVEIESWKYDEKQKYAIKSPWSKKYIKYKYRVWRQSSRNSNRMHVVFETHYEHKLLKYLTKRGYMTMSMQDLGEESLEKELSDEEVAKQFLKICKKFHMKIEDDYEYGWIRNYVYCETYDDDMGRVAFMVYSEKSKDWETVYETYSLDDMKAKLNYIAENDLWDVAYEEYDKNDKWWR